VHGFEVPQADRGAELHGACLEAFDLVQAVLMKLVGCERQGRIDLDCRLVVGVASGQVDQSGPIGGTRPGKELLKLCDPPHQGWSDDITSEGISPFQPC
jgi:hypothetical protein